LGLAIPVGKDSLSMHTRWRDEAGEHHMLSPVSLVVSAFAPVSDARCVVTPQLQPVAGTRLILVDVNAGRERLGGSALAQVWSCEAGANPDVDSPRALRDGFLLVQRALAEGRLLACHDRSDGGLVTTVLEMAFAGRAGVELDVGGTAARRLAMLFNEEPGIVVQVSTANAAWLGQQAEALGHGDIIRDIGVIADHQDLVLSAADDQCLREPLWRLQKTWAQTSYRIQRLRDNPACADAEFARLDDWSDPGLAPVLTFDPGQPPQIATGAKPRVAILREQGVNGQVEMAGAFVSAGFEAVDVHMRDLEHDASLLTGFEGLVACGGFSYGDVLGAGRGWAASILHNDLLRGQFELFFRDNDRFALGVCNGCQMLAALRELIPGSADWPQFRANESGQFEARLSLVEITDSPSLFFRGMAGSRLPVATAHGEGRAVFEGGAKPEHAAVALRYVEADGRAASVYPANPNGSVGGITGVCNRDGRVTLLMPHPERLLRGLNFSWRPPEWSEVSPWSRMFDNVRAWFK